MSKLEDRMYFHIYSSDLPAPVMEYRFAAESCGGIGKGIRSRLKEAGLRDWRFDFAWPDQWVGLEVEGGGWVGGRHTRGKGFEDDCVKYAAAARLGWQVIRVTGNMIDDGSALQTVEAVLQRAQA